MKRYRFHILIASLAAILLLLSACNPGEKLEDIVRSNLSAGEGSVNSHANISEDDNAGAKDSEIASNKSALENQESEVGLDSNFESDDKDADEESSESASVDENAGKGKSPSGNSNLKWDNDNTFGLNRPKGGDLVVYSLYPAGGAYCEFVNIEAQDILDFLEEAVAIGFDQPFGQDEAGGITYVAFDGRGGQIVLGYDDEHKSAVIYCLYPEG